MNCKRDTFYLLSICILAFSFGWCLVDSIETSNIQNNTIPTRNEVLDFLRDEGYYIGISDGYIGKGGNKAWQDWEHDQLAIEYMKQAIEAREEEEYENIQTKKMQGL
jgi:hypothetical protein